jgi:hypothetical protein
LKESEIPFLEPLQNTELNIYHCNTSISQCKIFHEKFVWEEQISRPSQNLIKDINDALDNERPYESLAKVFSEYGPVISTEVSLYRDMSRESLSDKQKLIPLYEILDDIKSRIQDLSTNKILMKGYTKYKSNKKTDYYAQFESKMTSDDYLVVGSVVVNNEKLKSLHAKFRDMGRTGFSIILKDDKDNEEIKE